MHSQSIPSSVRLPHLRRLTCLYCDRKLAEGSFSGLLNLHCRHCKCVITFLDGAAVVGNRRSGYLDVLIETGQTITVDAAPTGTRTVLGVPVEQLMDRLEARWAELEAKANRAKPVVAVGLRFRVFMRDEFRCRYCGRSAADGAALEADHVHPRSAGGQDTLDNLVTACWECNSGKSAKTGIMPSA